ncbi:MAG: hypothetical protein P8104_07020, partial [Gammaproteobacteria bacterium]
SLFCGSVGVVVEAGAVNSATARRALDAAMADVRSDPFVVSLAANTILARSRKSLASACSLTIDDGSGGGPYSGGAGGGGGGVNDGSGGLSAGTEHQKRAHISADSSPAELSTGNTRFISLSLMFAKFERPDGCLIRCS